MIELTAKERIRKYKENKRISIEKTAQESFYYHLNECGIRHPNTAASVRLNDSGDVEVFARGGAGFVASDSGKSFNIYGEHINLYSAKELKLNSDKLGLMWNFNIFNPDMTDVRLLVVDDTIVNALQLLINGGIAVTTPAGIGYTNQIGTGEIKSIRPFIRNAMPQAISDSVSRIINKIGGSVNV